MHKLILFTNPLHTVFAKGRLIPFRKLPSCIQSLVPRWQHQGSNNVKPGCFMVFPNTGFLWPVMPCSVSGSQRFQIHACAMHLVKLLKWLPLSEGTFTKTPLSILFAQLSFKQMGNNLLDAMPCWSDKHLARHPALFSQIHHPSGKERKRGSEELLANWKRGSTTPHLDRRIGRFPRCKDGWMVPETYEQQTQKTNCSTCR